MPAKEPFRVLVLADGDGSGEEPLWDYLRETQQVQVEISSKNPLPSDLNRYHVLVLVNPGRLSSSEQERVAGYVQGGGGCLGLVQPHANSIPPLFGAQAGPASPFMEHRLRFADLDHPIGKRFPNSFYLHGRFQPLEPTSGESTPLLTTMWQYQPATLALLRQEGRGRVGCITLQANSEKLYQQLIYRMVQHLARVPEPAQVGVGVVGYGPFGSVGHLHGLAVQDVPGLELRAVCDRDSERLKHARADFPGLQTYSAVQELARDPSVDLVIVATPPNTHAQLAIQLLREGKHVVCEKPMCLTQQEAEAMLLTAEEYGRVLSCYQNRRWDVDFLAIQQAVREGLIGELFYLETFVGSFSHPCDYWHSHEPISGGTLYDWGAHYVDWILNLFSGPTVSVVGSSHKRVWHDVTNADQVRAQVRFEGGEEAEFIHSDVAALRKPKWYLLGTEGAIVGEWNDVTLRQPDPLTHFHEEEIPGTETVPLLTLHRQHSTGSSMAQQLPLPEPRPHAYHLNLADHLLTGEPLAVDARSSARVVAVLEAASRSAQRGGTLEALRV